MSNSLKSASNLGPDGLVLQHNFVPDPIRDFKGNKRFRISCTNEGCKKKHVPVEVRGLSKICKGGAKMVAAA